MSNKFGPQKKPSSLAKILAENKSVRRDVDIADYIAIAADEVKFSRGSASKRHVVNFVTESNLIEGIDGCRQAEVDEFIRFMGLREITIAELDRFVSVYQPNAVLRDKPGLNVRIGGRVPLLGSPMVRERLQLILDHVSKLTAFEIHKEFEVLHPFTDCNGRSGRMLWAWMHRDLSRGFLHEWYYQSLR